MISRGRLMCILATKQVDKTRTVENSNGTVNSNTQVQVTSSKQRILDWIDDSLNHIYKESSPVCHVESDPYCVPETDEDTRSDCNRPNIIIPSTPDPDDHDGQKSSLASLVGDFEPSDSGPDYIPDTDEESSTDSDRPKTVPSSSGIIPEPLFNKETESEMILPIRSRKRQRHENEWKRNMKKLKINSGQEYVSRLGKLHRSKSLQAPCTSKCKLKCTEKISEDKRLTLFNTFYGLADKVRQRDYLSHCMMKIEPKRRRVNDAKRKENYGYYFEVDGQKIRVCKHYFCATLDVSNNALTTVLKKSKDGFVEGEKRGCSASGNKTSNEALSVVKSHINSFPRMPSHYCRADSVREYLDGSLNLSIMYRLYTEQCNEQNIQPVKKAIYTQVFNTQFNLSFFKPKKDLCNFCTEYQNMNTEYRLQKKDDYDRHIADNKLAREEKKIDKENSRPSNVMAIFDLQAVFQLPCGNTAAFFYKSKLNAYNFTIFDAINHRGFCYFWHEGVAKRGANEIATCLYNYLKNYCVGKDVIFWSDNCTAQNKNKYLLSMYIFAVCTLGVKSITHKYLISGHTQNEGDSMHACIEREKTRILKHGPIYVPAELVSVIKLAKKTGSPYYVNEYETKDFFDWKLLSEKIGKNYNIDNEGTKCVWNNIKVLRIISENPYYIYYKNSFSETHFERFINVRDKMRGRKLDCNSLTIQQAYIEAPSIPQNKKIDLMQLCESGAIPERHHQFFENIK